jgi:hypothetical protein
MRPHKAKLISKTCRMRAPRLAFFGRLAVVTEFPNQKRKRPIVAEDGMRAGRAPLGPLDGHGCGVEINLIPTQIRQP